MLSKKVKRMLCAAVAFMATSMVGMTLLYTNKALPSVKADIQAEGETVYTEIAEKDITEMEISNSEIGITGSESAFHFDKGDKVISEDNRIHVTGAGYWQWDVATKEINVNFKVEFSDWGNGWFGFSTADLTHLRIYNDKIELYDAGNASSKGTQQFAEKITSGWHTINMTYQYRSVNGVANGSRLTVTIDDVVYTIETDYYVDSYGHAFLLKNCTGTAVNVLSSGSLAPNEEPKGEMTYTEVPAQDIANMDISDSMKGITGTESAFNFLEIDEVAAEQNRIHYKGHGYWQWDIETKEINVDFHLEFTEWNGGWFGFRLADCTDLRIYNDKVAIYDAYGEEKGSAAFEQAIKGGWHTVNMTYQYRKSVESGAVNGSRLTVTIDGIAYEVKTNYYTTSYGNPFLLMNATGDPVNVLSATQTRPEITYSKVKMQEITDLYVSDGKNKLNFNNVETLSVGEYSLYNSDSYTTLDTDSYIKDVTFKTQFSYWSDGWIGFTLSNASVRIYNDKIALYSRNTNGEYNVEEGVTMLSSPIYSGWHTVRVVYQNTFTNGNISGSRLQVVIDGEAYAVECDYINSAGNVCQFVNATRDVVQVTSQNKTTLKDLSDWWIINNALRNGGYEYSAGELNAFNFLVEETVATGNHIFHDKPNYWSLATTYSTGGFEFIMSFDGWNEAFSFDSDGNLITEDGYFAIKIGTTKVCVYAKRAELYSSKDGGSTFEVYDTVEYGKKYTGKQDVSVLIENSGVGTKVTLTIADKEYILESNVMPAPTHSYLINETGTKITIQSQFKKKAIAYVESYLDYDNYYEREVFEAHEMIATAVEKIGIGSTQSSINSLVASVCKKLDTLPTKVEVDAMIKANTVYSSIVLKNVENQISKLDETSFTVAQWNYIQQAKQEAIEAFKLARNTAETDSIAEDFFAAVQRMREDSTKLAFYQSDITEKLQNVESGSELEEILQNALNAISVAELAVDVEDIYLAAVLAVEGNGELGDIPNNDLQGGGDFEKVETSEEDSSSDTNISTGCGATTSVVSSALLGACMLTIITKRKKSYDDVE